VGDPDKPKLVFFFDEAHLLFDDAPKALVDKVEQVARLIRSKGVGVYFVTQNPADVPEDILGQLGNRVQHALRAFTGKDQQDLRRAAQNYRTNPAFDIEDAIREVGTGEAVTSMLEKKGVPGMAERTLIRPPSLATGPDRTRDARGADGHVAAGREIRHRHRPRKRLRDPAHPRRGGRARGRGRRTRGGRGRRKGTRVQGRAPLLRRSCQPVEQPHAVLALRQRRHDLRQELRAPARHTNRARRWCAACWAVSSAGGECRNGGAFAGKSGPEMPAFPIRPQRAVTI
jgi:hypothetical protein